MMMSYIEGAAESILHIYTPAQVWYIYQTNEVALLS